ncbi:MAG: hypothetical protein Q8N02_05350 [Methylotenera sp.]|nr:hypothetical protein [Methylotenera sp.]MDP2100855.1 hypothetical protein [Methylotenera sp.]MDP2403858.1 hypothetical protein [Methylotenera sp.]MDP3094991.1 hypothetical protein [Methylotenera sp.]MDP3206317.1 hypothetical protein [Methylotenera sp.]
MPSKLPSRLVISRNGVYYLRLIKNKREQRWSLRTRDPIIAKAAAYKFGELLMSNQQFSGWTTEIFGHKVSTDGSDKEHTQGLEIIKLLMADQLSNPAPVQPIPVAVPTPARAPSNNAATGSGITVKEACDQYMEQRDRDLTGSTKRTYQTTWNRLEKDLGGDTPAHLITRKQITAIFNVMTDEKKARKTINGYAETAKYLFDWLIQLGEIIINPVMKPRPGRTGKARRDAQHGRPRIAYNSKDDFDKLFNRSALEAIKRPEALWLPLLAAFTGARLESLCRLTCPDFTEYEAGKYMVHFNIQWDKTGRERDIPLHTILIKAGLMDYVRDIQKRYGADSLIFPHLIEIGGDLGHYPSTQFGERRRKIGIARGKDLHGFRTTLISCLQFNLAHPSLKRAFVGHETTDPFGNKVTPDVHEKDYEKAIFGVKRLEAEILPLIDYHAQFGFSFDIENIYNKQMAMDKLTDIEAMRKKSLMQKERKGKIKKPA